jgi:hypothetical protein
MTYLVCTRNSKGSNGAESHGAGFLIGRISGVVPTPSKPGRFLVQFSEWAPLDCPDLWKFGRNPIHYLNLSDLGVDLGSLEFEAVAENEHRAASEGNGDDAGPLTIANAKRGLALALGVSVDNIEITIRV